MAVSHFPPLEHQPVDLCCCCFTAIAQLEQLLEVNHVLLQAKAHSTAIISTWQESFRSSSNKPGSSGTPQELQ
jgi:hypothetical protein